MSTAFDPSYKALADIANAAADAFAAYIVNPVSFTAVKAENALEDLKMAHEAYKVHIKAKATEPEAKRRC